MKKVIKLTESQLKQVIKNVINEQSLLNEQGVLSLLARDVARYAREIRTADEAVSLIKKTSHMLDNLDNIIVGAVNAKNMYNVDQLVGKVWENFKTINKLSDEAATQSTKNYFNGYAKMKGYRDFEEVKGLVTGKTAFKQAPQATSGWANSSFNPKNWNTKPNRDGWINSSYNPTKPNPDQLGARRFPGRSDYSGSN
jgi:hypothetical protein